MSPRGPVTGHRMYPQLIPEAPLPGGPGAPHLRGTPDKRLPDTEQRGARKTESTPLRLTVKHPHPQRAEGLGTKPGASRGGAPSCNTTPDWAHDPQEAAASRGVPQAGSKDCQQCPPPQPPAPTLVSMVTSQGQRRQPRSLETKEAPHPTGPGSLRSQGGPRSPGLAFLPRGPQAGNPPASAAWQGVTAAPKAGAETAETTRAGTPRHPDRPSVPFTGLLGPRGRPYPPHSRRPCPAPGTHLGLWARTCAHWPSAPTTPPTSQSAPQPQAALIRRRLLRYKDELITPAGAADGTVTCGASHRDS